MEEWDIDNESWHEYIARKRKYYREVLGVQFDYVDDDKNKSTLTQKDMVNKEDFVSYEQAVKLKELGFEWEYGKGFQMKPYYNSLKFLGQFDEEIVTTEIPAPTLSQVQQWLFDNHNVWVELYLYDFPNNFGYELKFDYYSKEKYCCYGYKTPKEALSDGIDFAIEHIKNQIK